jgi:AcrR family transcriptional regulator
MTTSLTTTDDVEKPRRTWRRTPPPEHTPSTREWIEIARQVLVEEGVVAVKIDRLARIAGVTRGGFYWRFKSREELLDALIEDWRDTNTAPLLRVLAEPGNLPERLGRLADLYIAESEFSWSYDRAVRAWAMLSPAVSEVVHAIDEVRIDAIRQIFEDAGHSGDEALVRARITYFHQVGYYAADIRESLLRRQELRSIYLRVLTGIG